MKRAPDIEGLKSENIALRLQLDSARKELSTICGLAANLMRSAEQNVERDLNFEKLPPDAYLVTVRKHGCRRTFAIISKLDNSGADYQLEKDEEFLYEIPLHTSLPSMVNVQKVKLLKDIYDDGQDCHPPGFIARKGEEVVVRDLHGITVSHEGRFDASFFIQPDEYVLIEDKAKILP